MEFTQIYYIIGKNDVGVLHTRYIAKIIFFSIFIAGEVRLL